MWALMKESGNKTMVASLLGVSRRTVIRYLLKYPIPQTFVLEESTNLEDFPEIKTWLKRMEGFANSSTINNYRFVVAKFFEWMKEQHPERAKPSLWTSDDILEYLYGNVKSGGKWEGFKPYQWHSIIVPLRSLPKKAPKQFPSIDTGLLPTKKTHKAKRSLAGKQEYYLEREQVKRMIDVASDYRDKALIAFIYNTAIRTTAASKVKIENLDLDNHFVRIIDKGSITWNVHGLSNQTVNLLRTYLYSRGNLKEGWLFANGGNRQLNNTEINKIIKKLGEKAGIEGKVLTAKTFRKSFVKHALTPKEKGGMGMNPVSLIGTGKTEKTCFCVGWSDMKVIMQHYAPQLLSQIEQDRQNFSI